MWVKVCIVICVWKYSKCLVLIYAPVICSKNCNTELLIDFNLHLTVSVLPISYVCISFKYNLNNLLVACWEYECILWWNLICIVIIVSNVSNVSIVSNVLFVAVSPKQQ